MEPQYYIELHIKDGDTVKTFDIGRDQTWSLEQAKQLGGQFYMGGYVYKESAVSLAPNYTLYSPQSIQKVRVVAKAIIS